MTETHTYVRMYAVSSIYIHTYVRTLCTEYTYIYTRLYFFNTGPSSAGGHDPPDYKMKLRILNLTVKVQFSSLN